MTYSTMKLDHIGERIKTLHATLPQGVTLIAVSKYHPAEAVQAAYNAGQRDFGESKAQDLTAKHKTLPKDINWHFIGHLQTNKVKYIAPFVHLIHSIDSYKLLCEVNRQGAKASRKVPCLLQIHIAQEETKFGLTPQECRELLAQGEWRMLENIELRGIMCMASNTDDTAQLHGEFAGAQQLFNEIKEQYFAADGRFNIISAGMSDDHSIAIEYGSTHIRLGSSIFCE